MRCLATMRNKICLRWLTWTILLLCTSRKRNRFCLISARFSFKDIDGNVIDGWEGVRLQCLNVTAEGTILVADAQKRISSYKFDIIADQQM